MTQDSNFKNILNLLKKINKKYPDLRFGAVLQEASDILKMKNNSNLFDISSKNMLKGLDDFDKLTESKRKGGKHGNSTE